MSKDFVKVHIGLLDPKHYEKMGKAVWLYLRILSKVEWESGVYIDWRDAEIADEAGLAIATVRNMRQQLLEEGYIVCRQNGRGLTIEVTRWRDPRKPSKKAAKPAEGDMPIDPSIDHKVIGEITTPTYSLDNTLQITDLKDGGKAAPPEPEYSDDWTEEFNPPPSGIKPKVSPTLTKPLSYALASVLGFDLKISSNFGRVGKLARDLARAGYKPEQITKIYGKGGIWYSQDWRGKKGDLPNMSSIAETIGELSKFKGNNRASTFADPVAEMDRLTRLMR